MNNFISGLILIFERPIQEGDAVQVGSLIGTVKRIGIRSSTVRTFDGSEVIVPNGNLISNEVVNWTMSDRQRRVELPVGVAYGTDPHRVIEILQNAAGSHGHVLEHPAPHSQFMGERRSRPCRARRAQGSGHRDPVPAARSARALG